MHIVGVIPARMGSSRFPGKPMARIMGMPMIGHVYHRAAMCEYLNDVWVATCDNEIYDYVLSTGGKAVMTSTSHERASDRTAEALGNIEMTTGTRIDFVVMVQGDEPMLAPQMIDDLVSPVLSEPGIAVVNLIERIESEEDFKSPNTVKMVLDQKGNVLYFSREPIPSRKKYSGEIPRWKQLGIILFGRDALRAFTEMKQTPLEIIESVDMNRFLEHGIGIRTVSTDFKTQSVDTPEDLQRVEELLAGDTLLTRYLHWVHP